MNNDFCALTTSERLIRDLIVRMNYGPLVWFLFHCTYVGVIFYRVCMQLPSDCSCMTLRVVWLLVLLTIVLPIANLLS